MRPATFGGSNFNPHNMKITRRCTTLQATAFLTTVTFGQTLDQAGCIPAVGTVEVRTYYTDPSASGLATSGTGNSWNLMGLTAFGISSTTTYTSSGASPYAATYPGTTICAQMVMTGSPDEWRHYNVTASIAELLGVNTDEFVGGRTQTIFPFSLGNTFTDSYTIAGSAYNDMVEYVASGSIQAPWGTIPNVVMFQVNGGPFVFYRSQNMLDAIGSYLPGFGVDLWQVEFPTRIGADIAKEPRIWPNPADAVLQLALTTGHDRTMVILDATGRIVERSLIPGARASLDVSALPEGAYTLVSVDQQGSSAASGFIIARDR